MRAEAVTSRRGSISGRVRSIREPRKAHGEKDDAEDRWFAGGRSAESQATSASARVVAGMPCARIVRGCQVPQGLQAADRYHVEGLQEHVPTEECRRGVPTAVQGLQECEPRSLQA